MGGGLRWTLLIAAVCFVAYALWWLARRRFRGEQRALLIDELCAERPDLELVDAREDALVMKSAGKETVFRLQDFYNALHLTNRRPTVLRNVRRKFALAIAEGRREVTRVTLAGDGARILPRVVSSAFFSMPARAQLPRKEIPRTGLFVVFCLDNEDAVRFLTKTDRKELGVGNDRLHALALKNLGSRSDMRDVLRAALESDGVSHVRFGDGFDASRVLLLPDLMNRGDALAAIVPDRDTLLLARAPKGDWTKILEVARGVNVDESVALLHVPLLVDASGIRRYDAA